MQKDAQKSTSLIVTDNRNIANDNIGKETFLLFPDFALTGPEYIKAKRLGNLEGK